ncbi:MAG: NHL repeat-containing protein [Spirochaetales bacterium]|nr:NHL repeat-containing protein [Spirochaetales bacterium]
MKTAKTIKTSKILFIILLAACFTGNLHSQDKIDLDKLSAEDEFKWGVKAYHRGLFNESARAFEKALSYKPVSPAIQEWLGLSWYRSGYTDAAIKQWEAIRKAGAADSLLVNRLEILKYQTGVVDQTVQSGRFLPAMELEGVLETYTLFKRPSSIFPGHNGGFLITAFGTNEILSFNANGAVTARINGGLEGFNHPFDLELGENGYLYVTEFQGDRITRCTTAGREILRFGETGRGEQQLLGPQFLAIDEKGFVYVSDTGNRKIVKFDEDGNFILAFGKKNYNFSGFIMPTGIECLDGFVYVADAVRADISVFDYSGNYITSLAAGQLNAPEGISVISNNLLLIADTDRIVSFNIDADEVRLISDLDGKGKKITQAAIDSNGNLIASDFDLNRITVLTELSNMYAGLFVQVDRIDASGFPKIVADIRVQDRTGDPFVGLSPNNFVVTENSFPVGDVKLVYNGNTNRTLETVVLIDADVGMKKYSPDVIKAVNSLIGSFSGSGGLSLVSAGGNPVTEAVLSEGEQKFISAASDTDLYSEEGRFDLGLRHAASELVGRRGRKTVVFLTDGTARTASFDNYHPVELAGYLKNNGIRFYCVNVSNETKISEELLFICEETGGDTMDLYQPEGLSRLSDELFKKADGSYALVYNSVNSNLSADDFIPMEIEAFLYNRSGREASGYYKPGR